MVRTAAVLGALAVVVGACSPGSSGSSPSSTGPVTTSTTAAADDAGASPPSSLTAGPDPCRDLSLGDPVPISPGRDLVEVSGAVLATEHGDGPSLWVHQDSGNPAVLTRVALDGTVRESVTVAGIDPYDWEDIGAAVDPDGIRHLFVGDIGDNRRARTQIEVVRVVEPAPGQAEVQPTAVLRLSLPQGPADAEALLVDPRTDDLVVLTKAVSGSTDVLVAPGAAWSEPAGMIPLSHAGTVELGLGNAVLAADVAPSGGVVGVRTPGRVLLWVVAEDQSLVEALLTGRPCPAPAPFDVFGEALALTPDGYVLTGESPVPTLRSVEPVDD